MDTGAIAAELLGLERKGRNDGLEGTDSERRQQLRRELLRRLNPPPASERRKFLRIPADLEVKLRLGQATITCPARELSMGGLSLYGHLWVIEDQELVLENLRVGSRDYPMEVKSRVVWKVSDEDERPRAGLQFVAVGPSEKRQIKAVFEQLFIELLERLAT